MPRPLRIIHLSATANGAPWMIGMAREQRKRGHDVSVVIPSSDGTIAPALERDGTPYFIAPCDVLSARSNLDRVRTIVALVRLFRRLRPDVVHSHIVNSVVTARIAAWIADVPIRFGANAGPITLESDLFRPAEIGTAVFDTRTIASCSYTLELYERYGIPRSKTDLVFYGPDASRFDPASADGARVRRELGISEETPLVGIVAYFYPPAQASAIFGPQYVGRGIKGHEVLIDAVPQVLAHVHDAKFALVGRGWGEAGEQYLQTVIERAQRLGVAHAVLFPGERSDVADTLASFDVSVHPSLSDNLGGTIESLLMARPMVVSDTPGYRDSVLHEETGLVTPRGDATALADAIVRLLRDRALARRLGENGRARMLAGFTLEKAVEKLDTMLARESARAEKRFRLATTIVRAIAMPFHLRPIVRAMSRVEIYPTAARPRLSRRVKDSVRSWLTARATQMRARIGKKGAPVRPRFSWPVKDTVRRWLEPRPAQVGPRVEKNTAVRPRLSWRVKYAVRRWLKPRPSKRGERVRIAQVAGVWVHSDWFVALCRDLKERGYEVIAVIDTPAGELAERLRAEGIRTHRLSMTFASELDRARLPVYALRIPLAALRLARILRREKIDIVHSHVFASVVVARLAAWLARALHVAGITGPRHLEAPLTRLVDRRTWWMDDITVAGCMYTRDLYLASGATEGRLECVYYGADSRRFDPARSDPAGARRDLAIDADAPLVTLVAQFYPPTRGAQTPRHMAGRGLKGHEDFLDAARIVAARFPDVRFVLAGSGVVGPGETYRRRLMAACAHDDALRDRVIFAGRVDDVPSLLAASDVAVQCSLTENLGGTIEALLMERPVVATRVGGMPESVRDGETGLLVAPADPPALAAAILRLLENRGEARALGRAGRRLMLERFTSSRTADDVAALYRRVMAGARA